MEPNLPPADSAPDADPVPAPLDARRRRILFRATHRGTHETDLLIGGFVSPRIATFTPDELDSLEELMEIPDVDLADWLMGRLPIPPHSDTPMLQAVLAAARARPLTSMGRPALRDSDPALRDSDPALRSSDPALRGSDR